MSYLLLAIILIITAHVIRVKRWGLLMIGETNDNAFLAGFLALSIGYIINIFVPFKVGELVRIGIFSKLGKRNIWIVVFSVCIERVLDLIVIYSLLYYMHISIVANIIIIIVSTLFLLSGIFLVSQSKLFNKLVATFSGFFNFKISNYIFHIFWSLRECFICLFSNYWKILFWSLLMWFFYFSSYYLLALSIGSDLREIIFIIFNNLFSSSLLSASQAYSLDNFIKILVFLISPLLLAIIYVLIKMQTGIRISNILKLFKFNSIPERAKSFSSTTQYHEFLRNNFNATDRVDILQLFYRDGLANNVVLYEIFHGGSGALTALVKSQNEKFVRKFAVGDMAEKLKIQRKWLLGYQSELSLSTLGTEEEVNNGYLYDMPYKDNCMDFYKYIHTTDIRKSWDIIQQVLKEISDFHNVHMVQTERNSICIDEYINKKISYNFELIKSYAANLFAQECIWINGKEININDVLKCIDNFSQSDLLISSLNENITVIHGDLTIENIIISDQGDEWFLIDPNPDNVYNTPLLDFAKIMQSLHMGYERLNREISYDIHDSKYNIFIHKSYQYEELYQLYVKWIQDNFGKDVLQEIYKHEIVHYLRLIPYKFNVNFDLGYAFTMILFLLISEYLEKYDN